MAEDRQAAMGAAQGAADEGISLETLPEEAVEKIMAAYRKGHDAADSYYRSKVEPALLRRLDVYRADKEHYRRSSRDFQS